MLWQSYNHHDEVHTTDAFSAETYDVNYQLHAYSAVTDVEYSVVYSAASSVVYFAAGSVVYVECSGVCSAQVDVGQVEVYVVSEEEVVCVQAGAVVVVVVAGVVVPEV